MIKLSGKITHSVVSFLEQKGEDTTSLQELSDVSMSFFCDPSSWLDADKIEDFLHQLNHLYQAKYPELMQSVGHEAVQLKSWGVLDKVLQMMSEPDKIFHKPQKLLTYFVNLQPPPCQNRPDHNTSGQNTPVHKSPSQNPLGEQELDKEHLVTTDVQPPLQKATEVWLQLPEELLQYPLALSYLVAAFEALPTFVQKPLYRIECRGRYLSRPQPLASEDLAQELPEPVETREAGAREGEARESETRKSETRVEATAHPQENPELKTASTLVASQQVTVAADSVLRHPQKPVEQAMSEGLRKPLLDMVEKTQATLEHQHHLLLSRGDEMNKLLLAAAADFSILSECFTKARQLIWHLSQLQAAEARADNSTAPQNTAENTTRAKDLENASVSQNTASQNTTSDTRADNLKQQLRWSDTDENFNRVLFHGVEQLEKAQRLLRPAQRSVKGEADKGVQCRQFNVFDLEK